MAKQRYINTHFWDDSYVVELDPIEKLLFLYFLTNPLTNIAGAYEVSLRRVAFDTGIDREMIVKILARFETANKIIYRDGWILITNFIKNQSLNPKMLKGVEDVVSDCPEWIKETLSIAYQSLSHLNRDLNRDLNPIPSKDGQEKPAAVEVDSSLSAADKELPAVRRIWKDGVDLLTQSGIAQKSARSLLGRLAKDYGNEQLAECIAVTQSKNPVNAEEFLIGALKERANGNNQTSKSAKNNGLKSEKDTLALLGMAS